MRIGDAIAEGLGYQGRHFCVFDAGDWPALDVDLWSWPAALPVRVPATFAPTTDKRTTAALAIEHLAAHAPVPKREIALPAGSPFGTITVDRDACTMCLACVGSCPEGALLDTQELPQLRLIESKCVQCGLCESTCPEKVITLEPRLDFKAWNAPLTVLKEEEPFNCIACGKPFGTKSSIDRVLAKLGEKHWMFQGANARRLDVIKMCADCRVEAVVNESFDPHAAPQRPPVMSTEDYLRARNVKKDDPLGS